MAKTVLVTGASGLVGRHLVPRLLDAGHRVVVTSRDPAQHDWPAEVTPVEWDGTEPLPWDEPLDAMVNLAGASIGGRRWNRAYKEAIRQSRLRITDGLVHWIAARPEGRRPALVTASAIGYYGIDPDGDCHEDRAPGDDFLGRLCQDWEATASQAPTRVVRLRSGHVLAAEDGFMARLLPIYRLRLGGPIAGGDQGLPWIHVEDAARAYQWAVETDGAEGAYNLAAPQPVTQGGFNKALARELGVCARAPLPGFALRIVVGELGRHLVGGQRTPPDRLQAAGFDFQHPDLPDALADLLRDGDRATAKA